MLPPPIPARAIPVYSLTPSQLEALTDLHRLKREAEREVERLIAFLDMVDGFSLSELECAVDDEPCDDDEKERSFVSVEASSRAVLPCDDELEGEDCQGGDVEAEPSLGWSVTGACGDGDDLELDESDKEPSLCGITAMATGSGHDLECALDDSDDEREAVNEDGDESDLEPTLGWHYGKDGMRAIVDSRGTGGEEAEPSLGSLHVIDQSGSYVGGLEDLEQGTTRRFVARARSGVLVPLVQVHHPVHGLHALIRQAGRRGLGNVTLI